MYAASWNRRVKTEIPAKARIDQELNDAARQYDSAYLSTVLGKERERAALLQSISSLNSLMLLPRSVDAQKRSLFELVAKEQGLRAELREARKSSESDLTNVDRLKAYFLDCLVRAAVPGITTQDRVELSPENFFPKVYGPDPQDRAVTSFATLSSGGKKTLFKSCFAIAVHRLAVKLRAPLPDVLILDSPMKNISERENREHFEEFYRMVYELKASELTDTQFVLIDKEFAPPAGINIRVHDRQLS